MPRPLHTTRHLYYLQKKKKGHVMVLFDKYMFMSTTHTSFYVLGARESRLLKSMPEDLYNALVKQNITDFFHHNCLTVKVFI